jgi:hypothetical protein
MGSRKHRWAARLISAAVALALVVASAVGAYAHALAHCHDGHANAVHQEGAEVSASTVTVNALHKGESQRSPASVDQAQCCDTICHGGLAIVDMGAVVLLPPRFLHAVLSASHAAGTQPHSLERPPRSPVLA